MLLSDFVYLCIAVHAWPILWNGTQWHNILSNSNYPHVCVNSLMSCSWEIDVHAISSVKDCLTNAYPSNIDTAGFRVSQPIILIFSCTQPDGSTIFVRHLCRYLWIIIYDDESSISEQARLAYYQKAILKNFPISFTLTLSFVKCDTHATFELIECLIHMSKAQKQTGCSYQQGAHFWFIRICWNMQCVIMNICKQKQNGWCYWLFPLKIWL